MNPMVFDIKLLNAGDRKGFREIYRSLYGSLCLFANRFVRDRDVAEDIVQESFIALWTHRTDMKSGLHVRSFLYQSCRNQALNYLKHLRVEDRFYQEAIRDLESETDFVYFVMEEEVERLLARTEAALSPKCKVIFLKSLQGKTNEEIAFELEISVNTVKTQKQIAYRLLKQYISELAVLALLVR